MSEETTESEITESKVLRDGQHRSYLYETIKEGGSYFNTLPEIEGRKCVGMHAYDVGQERDEAYQFIARLLDGRFNDPEEEAQEFFDKRGYGKTWQCLLNI